MRIGIRVAPLALAAGLLALSCSPRESPVNPNGQVPGSAEPVLETKGLDPRAAFESSGLLGGLSAPPESPIVLLTGTGNPEAGVALSLGGALSTAAIARRRGFDHELVLASGARADLTGPVLAMAASGERIVVACLEPGASALGSLACYKAEGEGEGLAQAWKKAGSPIKRLGAVPGGRVAVADESSRLYLLDVATGAEIWGRLVPAPAADIAYAPGLVLAASKSSLLAFDESTGAPLWSAALTANAVTISAGSGSALVLSSSGSLSAFALLDGKGIGAATGPFDAWLPPVVDGALALVGLIGGGAAEIDVKTGQTQRTWSWEGPTSFLAADRDRVYAGVSGRTGKGLIFASRAGDSALGLVGLESPAFGTPIAQSGARGGLLLLLMDGSLELVGKRRDVATGASPLDATIAPTTQTATAIQTALGRFKGADGVDPRRYLRFDLFSQGMPVDTEVAFTAFRYESPSSQRRSFAVAPASPGAIVAIFDETGRELAASMDELASSSRAAAYFEKGSTYWIVAGWTYQAEPASMRLYLK